MKKWISCLLLMATGMVPAWSASRPNIVIVMVDDSGFTDVGCYGGEIDTPNIDSLAKGGMRFRQFYNNGRCSPTRASLMTGRDSGDVGFAAGTLGGHAVYTPREEAGYTGTLPYTVPTIAELMKAAKYKTLMVGKWHLGGSDIREKKPAEIKAWKRKFSQWTFTDADAEMEFNALPPQRGFDEFFGLIQGETDFFYTENQKQQYREGNDVVPKLPMTGTYTMHCAPKGKKVPVNHGKTAPAFYATDGITTRAIEMINEVNAKGDEPYFLYVAHRAPHAPIQAPQALVDKYMARYVDVPQVIENRYNGSIQKGIIAEGTKYKPGFSREKPPTAKELTDIQRRLAVHAAMVEKVDENVGRLVQALKATGEFDNTLIFYFSDNGANPGVIGKTFNTPLSGFKALMYEGGVKTHAVASWPNGIKADTISDSVVWVGDLLPTCIELAGESYPTEFRGTKTEPLDGRSIVSALEGKTMSPPEYLYSNDHGQQGVTFKGRWKLLIEPGWFVHTSRKPGINYELYDLENDPGETENLAAQKPEMVQQLSVKAEQWKESCGIIEESIIQENTKKTQRKTQRKSKIVRFGFIK